MSRVYILLLNWNNWSDTLECLESLMSLNYPDFRIVVCDNGSDDDSLARLHAWAAGKLDVIPANKSLRANCRPCQKPLSIVDYDRKTAEQGGLAEDDSQLVFIQNHENLGFAGGNNVGLRYVLSRGDANYVWILNNDTVVAPGALIALAQQVKIRPTAGICGSVLLNYWRPRHVDALGGSYYCRWFGLAWHLGRYRGFPNRVNPEVVEKNMDYIVGASMFVSVYFLHEIGLMEESYFLYYEELDWAIRSKGRFSLTYAPESIVYHKVGGSIGTSRHPLKKSLVSDYYTLRNRLKFTRQHYPYALLTVYVGFLTAIVVRLLFGQWSRALMAFRLLINPHRPYDECVVKGRSVR